MKQLIIFTGDLAAMKSTLSKQIGKDLNIVCLNKDHFKEILGDTIGYHNRDENLKLSVATFEIMFHIMDEHLSKHDAIILESNLREYEFIRLKAYTQEKSIKLKTVFLTAEASTLYERFKNRHVGRHHVHASIGLPTFEAFKASMFIFDEILYGPYVMFVDTTEPERIQYEDILKFIST